MTKEAKDSLNDSSHAMLYKIAEDIGSNIPEYVMEGVPLTKEAAADISSDALFADETNRRYPVTDKANTWLSSAYFAKTAGKAYTPDEYKRVAKKLMKAAQAYGITKDVEDVMLTLTTKAAEDANAESERAFKEAEACYGEPETGAFPMFSEDQVKKACAYFDENAYAYDWRRREKIAKNILRKAAEYGITPSETVRKEAGAGFPRVDFLAENLLTRESELMRRGFGKMASDMRKTIKVILEASPDELLGQLDQLREMISGMDELSGIDSEYGRKFLPPADFLHDVSDDKAMDFKDDTVSLGNELLSSKALAGLPRSLFEKFLSKDDVEGMCDGGKLSPKKISITIVKMKPHAQSALLDGIRDFTDNAGEDMPEEKPEKQDPPIKEGK